MKGPLNTFKAINGLQSGKCYLGNSVSGDCLVLIRYDLMKNVPVSRFSTFQEENLIFSGKSQMPRLQRKQNSILTFLASTTCHHTVSEALSSAWPVLTAVRVPSPCALVWKPGW